MDDRWRNHSLLQVENGKEREAQAGHVPKRGRCVR